MVMVGSRRRMALSAAGVSALALIWAAPASAQSNAELAEQIEALRAEVAAQRALIDQQQQEIADLEARIGFSETLAAIRGRGLAVGQDVPPPADPAQPAAAGTQGPPPPLPDAPVGEAPVEPIIEQAEVEAIPEGQGVLTPANHFTFDPQLEYVNSSNARLVFRGIELVPGIQIGLIEATDADRDTIVASGAVRYGLTDRLEAEIRVPYIMRQDRIEVLQRRDQDIVRELELRESQIGDIEFGLRYQLNRSRPLRPTWIAQVRVKSDTGKSPYEIPFDEFGVATGLATGSGFWAVQPGVSFLLPSDPVVIFGGANYLWHIKRNIGRTVSDIEIGEVDPGDSIMANLGFGFALNPQFSFSLGYRHSYIFPTETELNETIQRSNRLQIGVFNLGLSYRLSELQTLNFSLGIGATDDAPDVSLSVRVPLTVPAPWAGVRD